MDKVQKQIAYNVSPRTADIRYIVVHDTGNPSAGADAAAHFQYFNGGNRGSSADVFVDDTSVWYVNDYTGYYSWHCGDGGGSYGITNQNSVGVELCVNADSDADAAFANLTEVVKDLMSELNIPSERVVRHYDASHKNCPASMSADNWRRWQEFKNTIEREVLTVNQYEELKTAINDLTETVKQLAVKVESMANPMIYNYVDENMPEWARASIQNLIDRGVLNGDENGLNLTDEMLRILVMMERATK